MNDDETILEKAEQNVSSAGGYKVPAQAAAKVSSDNLPPLIA